MKLQKIHLPLLIILSGVIFSLYLFSSISDEVYFSGDAGLKALLAKQFSSGNLNFNLDLSVPAWVSNLWNNGLYPFEPPFAYKISSRYYITFPVTFPLLTAPFYAILGFRGFYIVPLVSTWVIWWNFYQICQFFKLNILVTSAGLATLIFASPLSMYSAMYWEHTLAVCLAFSGLAIILTKGQESFSTKNAIFSGVLIALSVWFRPEFLVLVAILLLSVVVSYKFNLGSFTIISHQKTTFILSLIIPILIYFSINKLIYDHPLGAHALQVVEDFSIKTRLINAYKFFGILWKNLLKHFPILYFTMGIIGLSVLIKSIKLTAEMQKILLISIPFICLVPILLPSDGGKQWGPRFLLILIPLLTLLATFAFNSSLSIRKFSFRYISSAIFVALFVMGFHLNTYMGTIKCYPVGNTEEIDILNFLRKDSHKVVAVAHQYVSQTFESAFNNKIFFLTKKSDEVSQLSLALHEQGYQNFIYVCAFYDSCFSTPTIPEKLELSSQKESLSVQLREIKRNKNYIIQEAVIK